MENSKLYRIVISDTNIFSAIYSLESYVFEKNLLSQKDLKLYHKLQNKYDEHLIKSVIKDCRLKLDEILLKDKEFDIQVFFKAKKYDKESDKVEFRPIHTADLITQICMVSILNIIMYSTKQDDKRQLSDLSQLLPSNFYGNLPSCEYENIFYDWKVKYKEYTEDVMKNYESIRRNKTYKYEVALDLKKFFPSVDPSFIYNFISEKTSSIYTGEDERFFKQILKKLLCFNVSNLNTQNEINEYFSTSKLKDEQIGIPQKGSSVGNIGIPQGLPQSYFFGNIAMIPISKEFDKMFPGKSFYYVDDSVIYTNSKNASPEKFKQSLNELNNNIATEISKYTENRICVKSNIEYMVRVHEEEKSYSAKIESSIKMSKSFLVGVGLEASRVSFEINTTTDEMQDVSILDKILNIYDALEKEILNVKKHIEKIGSSSIEAYTFKIYLKSLIRYKKFFGYRKRILEFRQLDDISEIKEWFYEKYLNNKLDTPDNFESVFLYFDEDIFQSEAALILDEIPNDEKKDFIEELLNFDKRLAPNLSDATMYFSENFSKSLEYPNCCFTTLKEISLTNLGNFARKPEKIVVEKLKLILSKETEVWLGFDEIDSYNTTIFKNSNTYKRNILNSYISTIFNIDVSNDIEFIKLDKRPLKYYELRILLYIRNKSTTIQNFVTFLTSILDSIIVKNYEKVDFSLIEVLNIFKTHVKSAELIDNLILVHKYVSSVWRNGSRFLYFYTLHNQEHSVELIRSSVNICKMFDFLQIKSIDYYILFLACYLHDISMILQPSIDSFLESNSQTDEIYSSFLKFKQEVFTDANLDEFHFDNKSNVKLVMKDAFERVNYYFESVSRDTHVASSASFIKATSDLDFIDLPIRAIVSAVSAAHGANCTDIYGLKSNAKSEIVSEKYMMILLRVADLLDIAKDRVSLDILDRNIANMPKISQYHWITHSAIDKFEIKSEYTFGSKDSPTDDFMSILKRENFLETITVQIYLNTSNLTNVKGLNCKDVSSTLNLAEEFIEIEIGKGKECSGKCNFLCKWICHKNAYLLPELNALQQYIERTPNLNFTTKIKVKLNFNNAKALKSEYFDIVNGQLQ
ncbi:MULTISPECIES: HD domain-containing protein [Clostridium]|uniref:Reverse transcriptase domain-containing protein n=2 Tax=Clostridium butyricum TaxID=1492 RepID=A0AAP9RED8_CLOBU|nr:MULTISPECIES: reverse transcriptase domain-containing protein [Clostridium]ALP90569.1 hypothetical protein ATN24_10610 [Clostridium butyricum]ALS17072.1 hypothetical protein ATD26_09415 [Clostridium butyricum]ANF14188.1 hypothetical protein AZ909_09060 [Clostridium butyricum]AOR94254.1 hypothetical protein BBB49_09240 [Clostridium butyricum]EMU54883.1 hypothetical protein CBDKU1_12960 [Clostridium butyricum DKU-01]